MKQTLAIAIVLASIATYAQTETTTTAATTTAPAAPVVKSKVKKVVKKKSAKPSAQVAPAAAPAAVVAPVAAKESVAVTAPAAAQQEAAGTSTTSAAAAAPAKPWGVTAKVFSSNDFTELSNVQTLTSIGASYKVLDNKVTLKATETFESLTYSSPSEDQAKRDMINENNFRPSYTDLSVATTAGGILGSGDISTSLNLKIMGDDSYYTTRGGYANVSSMVEANLSMPYSITPKIDVSIDSQWRHVLNEAGPNSNRFLVIPSISYTFNEMFSVYQAGGVILSARDNTAFRRNYTRMYIETGATITPVKGLNIGMDVNQDKAVQSSNDAYTVSDFAIYRPTDPADGKTFDSVTYEAYVSYAF